jgi:transcriptional regulator with XRE-family HTH domain
VNGDRDVLTDLGQRITDRCRELGLTQAGLAARLGTTQAAVSRWMSGDRDPGVVAVHRIANALGLSVNALLGIDGADAYQKGWMDADRAWRTHLANGPRMLDGGGR